LKGEKGREAKRQQEPRRERKRGCSSGDSSLSPRWKRETYGYDTVNVRSTYGANTTKALFCFDREKGALPIIYNGLDVRSRELT